MRAPLWLLAASLSACARPPAGVDAPAEPVRSLAERVDAGAGQPAEPLDPPCPGPRYRLDLDGSAAALEPLDGAPELAPERLDVVVADDLDGDGDLDRVVSLGHCGNWGECVHAILLACGDSGLVTLASEPDHYAFGFMIEARDDGPPVLWELTRTAIAGADELGRVRWELGADGENTARRTDDYEARARVD